MWSTRTKSQSSTGAKPGQPTERSFKVEGTTIVQTPRIYEYPIITLERTAQPDSPPVKHQITLTLRVQVELNELFHDIFRFSLGLCSQETQSDKYEPARKSRLGATATATIKPIDKADTELSVILLQATYGLNKRLIGLAGGDSRQFFFGLKVDKLQKLVDGIVSEFASRHENDIKQERLAKEWTWAEWERSHARF